MWCQFVLQITYLTNIHSFLQHYDNHSLCLSKWFLSNFYSSHHISFKLLLEPSHFFQTFTRAITTPSVHLECSHFTALLETYVVLALKTTFKVKSEWLSYRREKKVGSIYFFSLFFFSISGLSNMVLLSHCKGNSDVIENVFEEQFSMFSTSRGCCRTFSSVRSQWNLQRFLLPCQVQFLAPPPTPVLNFAYDNDFPSFC